MRLISPREYASIKGYDSVSAVYAKMREGKIPWEWSTMKVKRIPWDDTKKEPVKPE